jgi:hypothetical protein
MPKETPPLSPPRVAELLSIATTPTRASVQTGELSSLTRKGHSIGRGESRLPCRAEVGGFVHPNDGLTTVVTGHGLLYVVEGKDLVRPQKTFARTGLATVNGMQESLNEEDVTCAWRRRTV